MSVSDVVITAYVIVRITLASIEDTVVVSVCTDVVGEGLPSGGYWLSDYLVVPLQVPFYSLWFMLYAIVMLWGVSTMYSRARVESCFDESWAGTIFDGACVSTVVGPCAIAEDSFMCTTLLVDHVVVGVVSVFVGIRFVVFEEVTAPGSKESFDDGLFSRYCYATPGYVPKG